MARDQSHLPSRAAISVLKSRAIRLPVQRFYVPTIFCALLSAAWAPIPCLSAFTSARYRALGCRT